MARRPPSDEEDEFEEVSPPPRRRGGGRPSPEAVRPWEAGDDSDPAAATAEAKRKYREKRPIYFRARDSLWFEPLVALCLVVLMIVALWAYTSNWPPLYVVESSSMQHGSGYTFGAINTGDMVLAKQASPDEITTYVVGAQTGYQTYTEFGDVILYRSQGAPSTVPIIHRALVYIEANADGSYSVPSLSGQACGTSATAVYSVSSEPGGCGTSHVLGTLTLFRVGWQSATVPINLGEMGRSSGFVTMGDNNIATGGTGVVGYIDQPTRGGLVQPSWTVGVARGLIPWFGAVKLVLQGQAQEVPAASWWFMGLTVAAVVLLAFGIHYAFRRPPPREPGAPGDGRDRDEDDDEEPPRESRRARRRRLRHQRPPPSEYDSPGKGSNHGRPAPQRGPGGDADDY